MNKKLFTFSFYDIISLIFSTFNENFFVDLSVSQEVIKQVKKSKQKIKNSFKASKEALIKDKTLQIRKYKGFYLIFNSSRLF